MSLPRRIQAVLLRVLRAVALVLAWVISFLFYFLVLGPYSIILRIAMGDLLERDPDPNMPTYWRRLDPARPRPSRPF